LFVIRSYNAGPNAHNSQKSDAIAKYGLRELVYRVLVHRSAEVQRSVFDTLISFLPSMGVGAGIKFERFPTMGLRSKIARLIQHAA
jgi:hypothetical protein